MKQLLILKKNYPAHTILLDVTDREAYVKAADEAEEVLVIFTF